MGSGSEVTKEAAKIVLTDDNFATLVRAVDLGRDIYRRISTYIKIQLTDQLPGWADGQCRSRHARSAGSCRRRAARRGWSRRVIGGWRAGGAAFSRAASRARARSRTMGDWEADSRRSSSAVRR
jgi:hypothetical protein